MKKLLILLLGTLLFTFSYAIGERGEYDYHYKTVTGTVIENSSENIYFRFQMELTIEPKVSNTQEWYFLLDREIRTGNVIVTDIEAFPIKVGRRSGDIFYFPANGKDLKIKIIGRLIKNGNDEDINFVLGKLYKEDKSYEEIVYSLAEDDGKKDAFKTIKGLKIQILDELNLGEVHAGGILSSKDAPNGKAARVRFKGEKYKRIEIEYDKIAYIYNETGDSLKVTLQKPEYNNLIDGDLEREDDEYELEFRLDNNGASGDIEIHGVAQTFKDTKPGEYNGVFTVRFEYDKD